MKFHSSFVLFFCLLHRSFANVTGESGEFCDEGPPGRYCLRDLSGWHDCVVEPSTGKMVDNIHSCPDSTRCACFYDLSCPDSLDDPCQPYDLPPTIPSVYTAYFNTKNTICSLEGCHDTTFPGREVLKLTEHKKRVDLYDKFWSSIFVLPVNGNVFNQTKVDWNQKKCETQLIKKFPDTQIRPYYSYNVMASIGYRLCEQWIWKTGRHNGGKLTSFSSYYLSNQTNLEQKRYAAVSGDYDAHYVVPVMLEESSFYNPSPVGKSSEHYVVNITSFLNGEVDEELLELPSFCQ